MILKLALMMMIASFYNSSWLSPAAPFSGFQFKPVWFPESILNSVFAGVSCSHFKPFSGPWRLPVWRLCSLGAMATGSENGRGSCSSSMPTTGPSTRNVFGQVEQEQELRSQEWGLRTIPKEVFENNEIMKNGFEEGPDTIPMPMLPNGTSGFGLDRWSGVFGVGRRRVHHLVQHPTAVL